MPPRSGLRTHRSRRAAKGHFGMIHCSECGIFAGHARTCPTQLVTREQRIAMVASLCGDSLGRIAREAGVPDDEIREGITVRDYEARLREIGRAIYGDPPYGAWPAWAMDELRARFPREEEA